MSKEEKIISVNVNQAVAISDEVVFNGEKNVEMGCIINYRNGVNYISVVANSQHFTSLEMILRYVEFSSYDDYLVNALKNTIEMGYKLQKDANS